MKTTTTLIFLLFTSLLFAQDITGAWSGSLTLPQGKLPLIINIANTGNGYSATMDSPLQKAKGIPLSSVTFDGTTLHITMAQANLDYKATYANNAFKGTWVQNGNTLQLNLTRGTEGDKPKRPQEPIAPFPYHTEDITFKNDKANITLAGTLKLPNKEGSFPVVILITGSGGQDRNEEIMGHKPFLVLADHLTKNGIAVLRFDDRGVGQSGGVFENATTNDFATDAEAALAYLKTRKEINKGKIGIAGHSDGGTAAAIAASRNPDVAFVVLMAAGNIPGDELMVLQNYMIGKAQGMPEADLTQLAGLNRKLYDVIKRETDPAKLKAGLTQVFNTDMKPLFISKGVPEAEVEQSMKMQVEGLASTWYANFIRSQPAQYLEKIKCPILAINGDKDLQVAAKANLDAVKRAGLKSGNKKITTKELPGLNHLFQETQTGLPSEYGELEQTFSPLALNEISTWIKQQVK